ncbi:MAG: zinc ABC transporter substrate-binding protein, partial [Nitrosopumilaceae archaeon]
MNDKRVAILAISIVIPLTAFTLWFSDQSKTISLAEEKQMKVLVSFYPLYEFTKEIGKERFDVSIIIPAGIEPHDWEPTIQDLQKMQNVDMIVINGAGFESWLDDFVTSNP